MPTAILNRVGALAGSRPHRVLVALIVVGLTLRVLAALAVWPVGLGINDSAPYTTAAASNPLSDAQAPAGYPAVLALLGLITRQVAVVMILQHRSGSWRRGWSSRPSGAALARAGWR